MEIAIHKDHFGRIFELPTKGMTYTLDRQIDFKNFKHSTTINSMVINPMGKKKVPFKTTHSRPKLRILHYLLTKILFPRIINHGYVLREDIVSLWLITQEIPTNWVEGILNHIIQCKKIPFAGLPYGPIITRLLATFKVYTMEETKN